MVVLFAAVFLCLHGSYSCPNRAHTSVGVKQGMWEKGGRWAKEAGALYGGGGVGGRWRLNEAGSDVVVSKRSSTTV